MAEVVLWGTRGSMPGGTAGMETYGSNTSCVSVMLKEGMIVFDGGTGLVGLGRELTEQSFKGPVHLFLSHLHLDHVIGLGCFAPLFSEDIQIHIYAMGPEGEKSEQKIKSLLEPPYWPLAVRRTLDRVLWHEIKDGQTIAPLKDAVISTARGIHEGPCLLYRLKSGEEEMAYLLDCEMGPQPPKWLEEFVRGCGLVIADGMYTDEEYESRKGWGHGTWRQCVHFGKACSIRRLYISHHSPDRTDRQLERIQQEIDSMDGGRFAGRYYLASEGERIGL